MIEEKYGELVSYLRTLAIRSFVYEEHQADIIHSAIERLLTEEAAKPFESPRALWGRATNVMKEEITKYFAASLPVSGVGRQAHHYARKYLAANGFDPYRAYSNQTETPRVGLDLLKIVAGGTGQTDPTTLSSLSEAPSAAESSLSEGTEDRIRTAVRALPYAQRRVVEMHMGLDEGPMPLSQVAAELGIEPSKAKSLWRSAKSALRARLNDVLT